MLTSTDAPYLNGVQHVKGKKTLYLYMQAQVKNMIKNYSFSLSG